MQLKTHRDASEDGFVRCFLVGTPRAIPCTSQRCTVRHINDASRHSHHRRRPSSVFAFFLLSHRRDHNPRRHGGGDRVHKTGTPSMRSDTATARGRCLPAAPRSRCARSSRVLAGQFAGGLPLETGVDHQRRVLPFDVASARTISIRSSRSGFEYHNARWPQRNGVIPLNGRVRAAGRRTSR